MIIKELPKRKSAVRIKDYFENVISSYFEFTFKLYFHMNYREIIYFLARITTFIETKSRQKTNDGYKQTNVKNISDFII